MDFDLKDPHISDPSLNCKLFLRVFQSSQILYRLAKFSDTYWRKRTRLLKVPWKRYYCRQIQVFIHNLDRKMDPSLQWARLAMSKYEKINTAHTFGDTFGAMTYKMLGTHGAIICSWLVLVFVWSWQSMEALNEAIGWAPPQSKVPKRSSQNSATLEKQLFTCTWGTRPPLLQKWTLTPGINGVTRFVVFLHTPTYLPLFGWITRMLPI